MSGAASSTYASPTYRREIDGLRALAVLPVIFFHAGFDWFRGGFVGVDVFFVISGYLITTVILAEQAAGTFSLVRFYERRARRILPALFFMLALTTAGAWVFLLPADLKAFAQSLTAVVAFYSNVLFAGQSGYFDTAAELKPLLHTWSLAVEEQFYLLFPVLLLLTRRLRPAWTAAILLLIGGASLAAAELQVFRPAEGMFLLQTRGWAVIIGALAALYVRRRRQAPTISTATSTAQLASALGIALVLLPVMTFSSHTPFPGLYGLVPTLGTALVILFATPDTAVGRVLGSAPLVGMGLISYSAYLWHQPLFAFARHASVDEPAESLLLWLTLLTVVLAYISWRWVEQPFRRPGTIDRRSVFAFALAGSAVFAIAGQVGVANEGFTAYYLDHRLSKDDAELYTLIRDHTGGSLAEDMVDDGGCHFWTRDVTPAFEERFQACRDRHGTALVVLGDSHAMNVYNLVAKANVDRFTVGVAKPGCRPQNSNADCHYLAFDAFAARHRADIRAVLFNQSGAYFMEDTNGDLDTRQAFTKDAPFILHREGIEDAITYLTALNQIVPVVWLGPYVDARVNFRDLDYLRRGMHMSDTSLSHYRTLETELAGRAAADHWPFTYASLHDILNLPRAFLKVGSCITFRDTDYFSGCGEDLLAPVIRKAYEAGRLTPPRARPSR